MSFYIIKNDRTSDVSVSTYLLDKEKIRIVLFSPPSKYSSMCIRWQYRYITNDAYLMDEAYLLSSTKSFDIWDVVLNVRKRDINFLIKGITETSSNWFSEVGEHNCLEEALPFSFIIPMISEGATSRYLPSIPKWLVGSTIYEIFVDRFRKHKDTEGCLPWSMRPPSNDFYHLSKFGGTLQGIIHSIIFDGCYLKQLGIGCIYMTPLFQSPSNHKYDVTNYYEIDKMFGNDNDLVNLVEVAHKNGIRIVLDGVFNHCSDTLKVKGDNGEFVNIFDDLKKNGKESKYSNWVEWEDNNHWRGFANLSHMPILNTEDDECANYLINAAVYWTNKIKNDGWRLDVANEIGTSFIKKLKERLLAVSPDTWLLGEILHNGHKWIGDNKLSGITNHHWRECVIKFIVGEWTSDVLDTHLQSLWHQYPSTLYQGIINYLNNHDTPRILTSIHKYYDYSASIDLNILAAILLFTSVGTPMIFYGEEIGMEGEGDPDCRKCMEWDVSQWEPNIVEKRLKLKDVYTKLITLRKNNPWLSYGGWKTIKRGSDYLYVYKRIDTMSFAISSHKTKEMIVVINVSNEDYNINIYDYLDFDSYYDILNDSNIQKNDFKNKTILARSGVILQSC